jgi:predicted secreted hydrolase
LSARDRGERIAIALELSPKKRAVMHGENGLSIKGPEPGNASAYMSWTRLDTRGAIEIDGRTLRVKGESWFDHEWGSSQLGAQVVGWDWFGLRLDDGRELMLYRLRRADGSAIEQSSATLVETDGTARHVKASDIELRALQTWKSPRTKVEYPARWKLVIASLAIDVEIAPRVADCEIEALESTATIYWEGPVAVRGSVSGGGYGELTGYAGSMAARF